MTTNAIAWLLLAATTQGGGAPRTVFKDCPECPEMVMVPSGRFTMGSSGSEQAWAASHGARPASVSDESPQHDVALPSFALGTYDVTRGEYAAFARETGRPPDGECRDNGNPNARRWAGASWENPGFSQTERDPVVCVSWDDARAYVAWLNGKVPGGPYRLPSESEWEYAARAGATTRFWWGDDAAGAADHAWFQENAGGRTQPVGSKPANAFGLFDMVGNVWQWTADCYAASYAAAPPTGGAACASIGADPGSTLPGSSARRPASATPPTTATPSWDSAWPERWRIPSEPRCGGTCVSARRG